jgi:histone deacetylase 1/2
VAHLFDLTFKKFGLLNHIDGTIDAILMQDEPEWLQIDACVASWLYTTVSKDIMDAVYHPQQAAFSVWSGILGLFLDNGLQRVVFAQQEFHSLYQGDMSITEYTGQMKRLADTLYDVGAAVTDQALVVNVLRGLNADFSSAITYLSGRDPPPSFLFTRSYLLQEERRKRHTRKMEAATALLAAGTANNNASNTASNTPPAGSASGGRRPRGKKSVGRARSGNNAAPRPNAPPAPSAPQWGHSYNPWTGVVQAWPLQQWRPPTTGVLGPRPGAAPPQAMTASSDSSLGVSTTNPFISNSPQPPAALLHALHGAPAQAQYGGDGDWFLDTGATSHMASHPGILSTLSSPSSASHIIVGNGAPLPVHATGHASIPTPSSSIQLRNVLISPSLIKNLVSVRALTRDNSVSVEFDPLGFSIKDLRTKTVLLRCDSTGDLYPLRTPGSAPSAPGRHNNLHVSLDTELWHSRLGHPGEASLHQILHSFGYSCSKSDRHTCHACRLGKHVRLPFSESNNISSFPFQLLHCDLWTSPIPSNSGFQFYLVILDDYSHFAWTFPLRHKSDVVPTIISFHAFVRAQFGCNIQCFQTDNGREFDNSAMRAFFATNGIVFRLTCPYTSQQNGRAERILRTLNDSLRAVLFHASVPLSFWPDALAMATYLLNRRPCRRRNNHTI